MKKTILLITFALNASLVLAQAPAAPVAAPPAAPVPITDTDIKGVSTPSADARLKGDPDGSLTGTVADIAVADSKKGITIADVVNQIGQNKIAINFVWTLVTGFLVMFMQAGFAIVETGLCRAKNANHTMMMNFMVYGVGMLAYWLIGFAIQMGGVGGNANLGGIQPLNTEFAITVFGKSFGLFGQHGLFLMQAGTYDVAAMVLFLFQMVFMDTALTIVTGTCAERWKYSAFIVSSFMHGGIHVSDICELGLGQRLAGQSGRQFRSRKGLLRFRRVWRGARCGRSHGAGGRIIVGPRLGKYTRQGKPNAIIGHDIVIVLTGCFILAFGWFGFNPGSTLGASGTGTCASARLRSTPCLQAWLVASARCSTCGCGTASRMLPCRATACWPDWWRSPRRAALLTLSALSIIGLIAGVLVCLSVEFVDRVMKVDDPVGAISVHGTNGLWGVISVGLFADGKSNYGGSWNGVNGSVTGLFYGDVSQLVAQLIGVSHPDRVRIHLQLRGLLDHRHGGRPRVAAKVELEGLDLPEMGQLGYPEFELKPGHAVVG